MHSPSCSTKWKLTSGCYAWQQQTLLTRSVLSHCWDTCRQAQETCDLLEHVLQIYEGLGLPPPNRVSACATMLVMHCGVRQAGGLFAGFSGEGNRWVKCWLSGGRKRWLGWMCPFQHQEHERMKDRSWNGTSDRVYSSYLRADDSVFSVTIIHRLTVAVMIRVLYLFSSSRRGLCIWLARF